MSDYRRRRLPHRDDEHLEHSFVGDTVNRGRAWVGERKKEAHAYIDRAKNAAGKWIYAYPGQVIRNGKVVMANAGREARKAYQHAGRAMEGAANSFRNATGLNARSEWKRKQAQYGRTGSESARTRARNARDAYSKTLLGRAETAFARDRVKGDTAFRNAKRRGRAAFNNARHYTNQKAAGIAESLSKRVGDVSSAAIRRGRRALGLDAREDWQNARAAANNSNNRYSNNAVRNKNARDAKNRYAKTPAGRSEYLTSRARVGINTRTADAKRTVNNVIKAAKQGLTPEQIANRYNMTVAQVKSIFKSIGKKGYLKTRRKTNT